MAIASTDTDLQRGITSTLRPQYDVSHHHRLVDNIGAQMYCISALTDLARSLELHNAWRG